MLRRHHQLRTQINQLKDTTLFAVSLWLAHVIRSAGDWDFFGLADYLHSKFPWEIFNPSHAIEPFSQFKWLYVILIPAERITCASQSDTANNVVSFN
jgi:hypothetical protein